MKKLILRYRAQPKPAALSFKCYWSVNAWNDTIFKAHAFDLGNNESIISLLYF